MWAAVAFGALVAVIGGALVVNTYATNRALDDIRVQQADLRQQAADVCAAEREIRAKITEIEVELGTHVYVPLPTVCALRQIR